MFENHKKKVSFNIASEASYVYILSRQKLIKNAKNGQFLARFFKTWSLLSNSATRHVNFGQKLLENAKKLEKSKWDILSDFQTLWKVAFSISII